MSDEQKRQLIDAQFQALSKLAPRIKFKNLPRIKFEPPKLNLPIPTEEEREESMRYWAEAQIAPLRTRDAVIALLAETRANARRERWIIGIAVAGLVVSIVGLLT